MSPSGGKIVRLSIGEHEARLLRAHLERLQKLNSRSVVRIVAGDGSVGIYATPPLGVMTYVQLPLVDASRADLDVTVLAVDAAATIICADGQYALVVDLRHSVPGGAEIAVLPPNDGWQLPIPGVASDVVPMVDAAVADFKTRAQTAVDTDGLAAEIWDEPSFGGLPLRALHAARLMGLLSPDSSRVAASTRTGWKKFTTVKGQVFVRVPGALDRPALSVVR
ncbi:MAG: hypothetical protein WAO41_04645 [Candidatus Nanopelagicales bacterium]